MKQYFLLAISLTFFVSSQFALADVLRSEANSGNLVMEVI